MARKDSNVKLKVVGAVSGVALVLALTSGGDPEDDESWAEDEPSGPVDGSVDDSPFADGSAGRSTSPSPGGADLDIDLDGDAESVAAQDDAWAWEATADVDDDSDDADPQLPPDDPWTRGSPASQDDGDDDDDDDTDPPADDPWTRGQQAPEGGGLPPCTGTMEHVTGNGRVQLPTDRGDEAFASADCALGPGRRGAAVSLVQAALNECNGHSVPVTGVIDQATSGALAAVQAHRGLAADGVYGPGTRAAMVWPTQSDDGHSVSCVAHPDVG